MGRSFELRGDDVQATLAAVEVELLRDLRDQVRSALLSDDRADPVLQRLFPSAVLGDQDADAELRALLRVDLLESRLDALDELVAVLDRGEPHRGGIRVDLVDHEPVLVLGVLNDLRLAIGARIDIESLDRDGVAEDDALAYPLAVMDHLAWMQEQLLEIVDPPSLSHYQQPPPDLDDHAG